MVDFSKASPDKTTLAPVPVPTSAQTSSTAPSPAPNRDLSVNNSERVLQPPTETEMLSEPQPAPVQLTPEATQPEPAAAQPEPAQPTSPAEKDIRPEWARGVPPQDPVAGLIPKYKVGRPEGVYFTIGIMLVPAFILIQMLFLSAPSLEYLGQMIGSLNWQDSLLLLSVVVLFVGALLLLFTRSKVSRLVSILGLLLFSLSVIISIVPLIGGCSAMTAVSLSSSSDFLSGVSRVCGVSIFDGVLFALMAIALAIYLSRPHVKVTYS